MRHAFLAFLVSLSFLPLTAHAAGDLSLSDASVWFKTDSYLEGHTIRIWASVANNSGDDLLGSVHFTANGSAIGADQPVSALAGKGDDTFVDWTPSSYGAYTIQVTVIPWDKTGDNAGNNTVSKQVTVEQDTDHDGIANPTDPDDDNDGTPDAEDAFPLNASENKDSDGDGQGNNADLDDDNDNTPDTEDDLPEDPDHTKDTDHDGIADEEDEDLDGDGLLNTAELETDPANPNTDGDFKNDGEDTFPTDPKEWADLDGDGTGDNSDSDIDGDGLLNTEDSNPSDPAPKAQVVDLPWFVLAGEDLTLDASASKDDSGIVKYEWQFDDQTEDGSSVTHSFKTTGLQISTLTVFDASGQSDTLQVKVHVFDRQFLLLASSFALFTVLLAFYLIYRYNRRALKKTSRKKSL